MHTIETISYDHKTSSCGNQLCGENGITSCYKNCIIVFSTLYFGCTETSF